MNDAMQNNFLNMPKNSIIIGEDDAFLLRLNLMKPYSQNNLTIEQRTLNQGLPVTDHWPIADRKHWTEIISFQNDP